MQKKSTNGLPLFSIATMEKGSSSSSSSATAAGGADSFSGLRFGKKIYFETVSSGFDHKTGGGPSPSAAQPPSPAKKGRIGVVQGGQPPRCQVEGCEVDLSGVKAYYSRHKVCGMHSKSAKVIVAGIEQRFCQQCSRFHQLAEFDQGKRSCRHRLAGHNERRRKPPPGSSFSSRYGNLCPSMFDHHSKTGGFLMNFGAYPYLTARDSWPNATTERILGSHTAITGKYPFPWQSTPQNPLSELLQGTMARSDLSISVSSEECLSGVSDSTGALSLLSNEPWGSRIGSSSLGVNNFLGSSTVTTLVQPSVEPGAPVIGQFGCRPWSSKGNHNVNHLHEPPPDLGLGQTSHSGNNHYTGELGLAQPNEGQYPELNHSRVYASPVQHMHWSR